MNVWKSKKNVTDVFWSSGKDREMEAESGSGGKGKSATEEMSSTSVTELVPSHVVGDSALLEPRVGPPASGLLCSL